MLSSMSNIDLNTDRSYQTNASSLVPPTSVPKHFTVPFAIQHGYFRCVRYLLQLCYDPNERDSQLRTPLILCSYIENDRWCLSLAQNLLEKGAKIALEDHARRNA
jgi:ankyrin repeat protein